MSRYDYRAWCIPKRMMYSVYSIERLQGGLYVEGEGVPIGNGWASCVRGFNHQCDVVLMQYLGKYGRHGEPLCEGDIVKDGIGDYYWIEWDEDSSSFVMAEMDEDGMQQTYVFDEGDENKISVVGDIYNEPHLVGIQDDWWVEGDYDFELEVD